MTPLAGFKTATVTIADKLSCTAAQTYGLVGTQETSTGGVNPFIVTSAPVLSVTTSSLPEATVGVSHNTTLQAAGGDGASTWSLSSGSLPAGLSLDATTGVISGTPTTAGDTSFVAEAGNGGPPAQTATGAESITVSDAPTTTPSVTTTVHTTSVLTSTPTEPAIAVAKIIKVSSKGTKFRVSIACAETTCDGTLVLSTVEHLKGTKVTTLTAIAKARIKTLTLTHGSYTVTAGKSKTVTLTLSKAADKLLTARHHFPAELALTPKGSKTATAIKTVALRATPGDKRKTPKK